MPAVTVAMAPGTQIRLEHDGEAGGRWSLQDSEAGTFLINDPNENYEIYSHGTRVGIQKIVYSSPDREFAVCNIVTIVPHDHSDMYRGGPAYGVYKSN